MTSIARLDQFGFLAITGKDAQKFLQGYVTCDMQQVSGGMSAVGAICNLQGRMVTSFRIAATDNGYLLRMTRDLVAVTMTFLEKYIVFSKAEMTDGSDAWHCFACIGEGAGFPEGRHEIAALSDGYAVRVASEPRFEVWTKLADWMPPDADAMDAGVWQDFEIDSGIAWVTPQTSAQFIPQMFDYHRLGGLSFDKGCYLGQEIVARMQYRGALSRRLLRGRTQRPLVVGDALQDDRHRNVGEVVATQGNRVLAVVQVKDDELPQVAGCDFESIAD